jgi:hypothetical protein
MRGNAARGAAVLLAVAAAGSWGCFDEPGIEERWTRVDLVGANVTPAQALPAGAAQPVTMNVKVTFRTILTGYAVADLRVSHSITNGSVALDPDGPRLQLAQDIDRVLANSVSVGRATRAVTGWDHLVFPLDLSFTGAVPATLDSAGLGGGLFLVCYLGAGEKMERADGTDTLIVTPFGSEAYQVLPFGMKLALAAPVPQVAP